MDWRAIRLVGMAVALGSVIAPARQAAAFSMAEQVATTGVSNTLAGTGSRSASGTIGSVKNKLSASTPKLTSVRQPTAPRAGGAVRSKRTSSGKSGWGDAKGWARNGKGKGGKGGKGWVDNGGWPKADGWASKSSKAWVESGGGAWARPGNKG